MSLTGELDAASGPVRVGQIATGNRLEEYEIRKTQFLTEKDSPNASA